MAPLPAALREMVACALETHITINVFGELGDDHEAAATTERYDTDADEWTMLEPVPERLQRRLGRARGLEDLTRMQCFRGFNSDAILSVP